MAQGGSSGGSSRVSQIQGSTTPYSRAISLATQTTNNSLPRRPAPSVALDTHQCFFWGFEPRGELRGGAVELLRSRGGGDLLRGERGKFETSVLVLRGAARRPQNFFGTFRWPYAFPPLFSEHPETFGGTEKAQKHLTRGSPLTAFWLAPRGEPRGGADRYPRIQGGSSPPVPPCSKDSGPHEKVDRKTQFSDLDLDNFSECFKELTQLLFTKIACIGIRFAYFIILDSIMTRKPQFCMQNTDLVEKLNIIVKMWQFEVYFKFF